ncbi:hypothetical protein KM043_005549 [Ampulex compressa]|nr:hypothetical protein KM043_005549 [Ampulex compressa]
MNLACACAKCRHSNCPHENLVPPYDEVSHEIDNNIISVKIPRRKQQSQSANEKTFQKKPIYDANCVNVEGKKCKDGCTKVNIVPNKTPPRKKPEEETLSLRTIRQIMPNDDLRNTLEIEFKAPRNYIPLPGPGPPPAIIVPKQSIKVKKGKIKGKVRGKN